MEKNYNYKRRKLYLPEYGRHIQEMIDSPASKTAATATARPAP